MKLFAPHQIDVYKTGHKDQYPKGTELVYSNLTARSGKHSNVPNSKGIIFVGLQLFIKDYLIDEWNESFFRKEKEIVVGKYYSRITRMINQDISMGHLRKLHDLGFLPIQIKALPEGSFVPYKVPVLTVQNTLPEFYWLTNYIESVMSAELWPMINSATTAREYLKVFYEYSQRTCDDDNIVPFQGHDFSFRGMFGREAAAKSGFAALCSFQGTDTVSAIDIAENYYNESDYTFIGGSVNATEHSCMASSINEIKIDDHGFSTLISGTEDSFESNFRLVAEYVYFKRLLTEVYPEGIVSVVSDTYDFWGVVTEILPRLKDVILSRNGKLVIRPDSGDPVDIICGISPFRSDIHPSQPEAKGLIECLWEIFGGTINSKGYKVLDSHIGAIYGDSITLKRQQEILSKLEEKGFASSNIILGIGSYTYQNTTRDTHGIAMKATYCEVFGKGIEIYKDPKTDDGTKKSAKGLLMVSRVDGKYELKDQCNKKEEGRGCLKTIFYNGNLLEETSLSEIRNIIKRELE